MTKDQVKAIPLPTLLQLIGAAPVRQAHHDLWYLSPWREEKTASLHVHTGKNVYYDHGEGKGGDSIAFIQRWLKSNREDHTLADVLRWAANMTGGVKEISVPTPPEAKRGEGWIIKKAKPLQHLALTRYLRSRGIPLELAAKYLQEVYVRNAGNDKGIFAIGFKNEEGGYELRNPFFKSSTHPKTISFIRANGVCKPEAISVFEGWTDFLSAAARYPELLAEQDCLCLNSVALLKRAFPYLKGYGYKQLHSWLDNDRAGQSATKLLHRFVQSEPGLRHKPMNALYQPHKDVNDWHRHTLNLKP